VAKTTSKDQPQLLNTEARHVNTHHTNLPSLCYFSKKKIFF